MNGVTTDQIIESDLAVLVRCGILHERIADLFWGWGVCSIGDFIAARDVFQRLPHLQSEVAQRELEEAVDTVERAMELLQLGLSTSSRRVASPPDPASVEQGLETKRGLRKERCTLRPAAAADDDDDDGGSGLRVRY